MFSNLTLVSINCRLKVGGVQCQGKKLGGGNPIQGRGQPGTCQFHLHFRAWDQKDPAESVTCLHSGDIVLSSGILGFIPGPYADE